MTSPTDARRHAEFWRICLIGVATYLAYDLVRFPFVPRLADELGAGPALIGWIAGASTMTGVVGKWLTGGLSDYWGRRRLLLYATCAAAVMPLCYVWIRQPAHLLLARFLHGTVTATLSPVARAVVSDLSRTEDRGRRLGVYSSVALVGQSAGRWLGGLLLFWGGFRYPALAAVLAGAVAVALCCRWRPASQQMAGQAPAPTRGTGGQTGAGTHWAVVVAGVRHTVRSPVILLASLADAAQYFGRGTIEAFVPIYAVHVASLHDAQVGMLFGLQLLAIVLARPLCGAWSDRIGRAPLIVCGLAMSAATVWRIPYLTGVWPLASVMVGYSLGMAVTTAATVAQVGDAAAPGRAGAAQGVLGTVMDIGHASGPVVAGWLVAGWGYVLAYRVVALCCACMAVACAIGFGLTSGRGLRTSTS